MVPVTATNAPLLIWLVPSLASLFAYGIGQGLVKKWSGDVPPARFCLYYVVAKAVVNLGYFASHEHPSLGDPEGREFVLLGVLAYVLDGTAWILYFESIVLGPVAIVGTLSAAYPALTVVFARVFLDETLSGLQYAAVAAVITGCLGLSYTPGGEDSKVTHPRWIPLSFTALVLWAASATVIKFAYGFPQASEATLAACSTMGGMMTVGAYGVLRGRGGQHSLRAWVHSSLPMGLMAAGDLAVLIATRYGPISIVTPMTGAYPVVTLGFAALVLKERITRLQWACLAAIVGGICLLPPQ
jgi:drug/metabolite transporter (DMT)-like permease